MFFNIPVFSLRALLSRERDARLLASVISMELASLLVTLSQIFYLPLL